MGKNQKSANHYTTKLLHHYTIKPKQQTTLRLRLTAAKAGSGRRRQPITNNRKQTTSMK